MQVSLKAHQSKGAVTSALGPYSSRFKAKLHQFLVVWSYGSLPQFPNEESNAANLTRLTEEEVS